MLCVKTKLKRSKISGIGLFAFQNIRRGTVVWTFDSSIDLLLTKAEISKLSKSSQKQIYNYAFLDKYHGKYMLCGDDARFFNHSETPNCDDSMKDLTVALQDIEIGEELTVNYYTFYADLEFHPEIEHDAVSEVFET